MRAMRAIKEEDIQQDPNIIETGCHTLFIEEIPDEFVPMELKIEELDEEGNRIESNNPPDIYERIQGGTKYSLYLGDFMSGQNENSKIFHTFNKAEPNSIVEININSDGGSFFEILSFYNTIVPKFPEVTTFLNYGYSAGSMAFLLGTKRIVYEHSDMMIHSYSGGNWGKRQDLLDQTEHHDKIITGFFNKIYSPYFSKKEMKKINKGKDFWLDSKEMLKRGIATHIITDDGMFYTGEEYNENYKEILKGK